MMIINLCIATTVTFAYSVSKMEYAFRIMCGIRKFAKIGILNILLVAFICMFFVMLYNVVK